MVLPSTTPGSHSGAGAALPLQTGLALLLAIASVVNGAVLYVCF
jgi:hypothetical protein